MMSTHEHLPPQGNKATGGSGASQMPVIERAKRQLLLLGSGRSRGCCLEMICTGFLAGANLYNGDPDTLLFLEIRHKHFRNHSGDDSEQHLITLCTLSTTCQRTE